MFTMQAATPTKKPVTAKTARFIFYDIEALNNAFTLCAFDARYNSTAVFYLVDEDSPARQSAFDTEEATRVIMEKNPALLERFSTAPISFFDLSTWEGNHTLARTFGLSDADSINDPDSRSSYGPELRPVCDTDENYDPLEKHGYYAGYNSFNYDTVMLAIYFMEAFAHLPRALANGENPATGFRPAKAHEMRAYNDDLFTEQFRGYMPRYLTQGRVSGNQGWKSIPQKIRQAMIDSGRHLDVARLNELQQRVALKRLLGGLGRQILESDKLSGHNASINSIHELYELLAYNVSDVVGLHREFEHPVYSSGFDLKKGLLDEYPETIYERAKDAYAPNISPKSVRRGRLCPDSTSAKFVGVILSPYGNLSDMESVSYLYPSQKVADELGITRVNVLDECRKFFHENITDEKARQEFQLVYDYYRSIEGQNFNSSEEYMETWPKRFTEATSENPAVRSLMPTGENPIPKAPNNLPYFDADGKPTECFVTFSTGGIHGAEANMELYGADLEKWEHESAILQEVRELYPDPLVVRTAKTGVPVSDGTMVMWKDVLTSKTRLLDCREISAELEAALAELPMIHTPEQEKEAIQMVYDRRPGVGYRSPRPRPVVFKARADGSTKLEPKYTVTSLGTAIHEDFTSYYPNMLRNMGAFYNHELGIDRYAKILADKDRYQVLRKEAEARGDHIAAERYNVLRDGTKLILNSASGAGDMQTKTPIRMNNNIISMRIIGQLSSWRIGQAQTLAGGRIISTNTDGLYSVLDEETNNRVLAEQQALIHVEIEPEPLLIVTKDSNNRLELMPPHKEGGEWKMLTSGGTLACHRGPRPDKSLAHPAVIDWALARYLRACLKDFNSEWAVENVAIDKPFNREYGRQLLMEAARIEDPVFAARLFQNIITASIGKLTFPFAADPVDPVNPDPTKITNPRALQHYNRVFFVHPGKPGAVSLRTAGAWVVTAVSKMKRQKNNEAATITDPIARKICEANGFARTKDEASQRNMRLLPSDQDVSVRKITRIEPTWNAVIENGDLVCMPEEKLRDLLGCLDLEAYLGMLSDTFENNWMNGTASQGQPIEDPEEPE